MIVVDSSVWVDFLAARPTRQSLLLKHEIKATDVLVGDLILAEVLMGARSDAHAARLESVLKGFRVEPMAGAELAVQAAAHFRRLRALGFTVRKLPDLLIGTFCIRHGYTLLHNDRDFDPMAEHLGLRVI